MTLLETPKTGFQASRPNYRFAHLSKSKLLLFYKLISLCSFDNYHSTGDTHQKGGNRKLYQQLTNADQKSIETVFSIAICCPTGDEWQSKTLFLLIFDLRSSIVLAFSIAA